MLKLRGSVQAPRVPQFGHTSSLRSTESGSISWPLAAFFAAYASCMWSARNRLWQDWHSVSGSVNVDRCPLASQVLVGRITEESRPTTSSRPVTVERHHCRLRFSFSSPPSGPESHADLVPP